MTRWILLDAGVVGLMYSSPLASGVAACRFWAEKQARAGAEVLLTDLTDFEVRRELLRLLETAILRQDNSRRLGVMAKLRRLDDLHRSLTPVSVDSRSWRKAAEFWAGVRVMGKPTASPDALDGDAILAAVAATIGGAGNEVIIATTNVGHLMRFPGVDARMWETIA